MPPDKHHDPAERGDTLLRCAQTCAQVQSRHQLFLWSRLHLHHLLPHELMLCMLAPPGSARPVVTLFNSVPLSAELQAELTQPHGSFWRAAREAWQRAGNQPCVLNSADLARHGAPELAPALFVQGFEHWLIHGLDEPDAAPPGVWLAFSLRQPPAWERAQLTLWLPHLALALERVLRGEAATPVPHSTANLLTERECAVLHAVRQAHSNAEIGIELGISPLTVKNHLRNIMRKLGARSRGQAVVEAMARQLL